VGYVKVNFSGRCQYLAIDVQEMAPRTIKRLQQRTSSPGEGLPISGTGEWLPISGTGEWLPISGTGDWLPISGTHEFSDMAPRRETCAHCAEKGVGFDKCSICKTPYCGRACQIRDWKSHKKNCTPPVPAEQGKTFPMESEGTWPETFVQKVLSAANQGDWPAVLKLEGCMEELVVNLERWRRPGGKQTNRIFSIFSDALADGYNESGNSRHARSYIRLLERQIPLLGKLQRFRDQGEAMCNMAVMLYKTDSNSEGAVSYQRARKVAEQHGFFTLESRACTGLGIAAIDDGRRMEGLDLLRNGLKAAELNELDDPQYELVALSALLTQLFASREFDEVKPLLSRYRDAGKAHSVKERVCWDECLSLIFSARLHEVIRLYTPM